jgi:hypothetical protein
MARITKGKKGGEKMRLNHSRYIDVYARDIGDRAYRKAKATPTAKQVRFYKKLYAMCKENGVDPSTGKYTKTRIEYAMAIDELIKRLQEHGVDVSGNKKEATLVLTHGSDRRGRYYTNERIEVREGE